MRTIKERIGRLNTWLTYEVIVFLFSTGYLSFNWNQPSSVGTNAISLLWVEILYLIYLNLKERER